MTGGEVAVRENGNVTAVETTSLDGDVSVNLDHDPPLVGLPKNAAVQYEGGDVLEDTDDVDGDVDDADGEARPDGGMVRESVRVRQYGLGLTGEARNFAIAAMGGSYLTAGYLWNAGEFVAGLVVGLAAIVLTHLLANRRNDDE